MFKKAFAFCTKSIKKEFGGLFSKENTQALMVMLVLAFVFVLPDVAMAAGTSPLETMKTVYLDQAQTHAFPVIIMWTLILGVVISFTMGKFMPLILAIIASVIIAITPNIAPNFTGAGFGLS